MKYSELVNSGRILPRKDKYTVTDVLHVMQTALSKGLAYGRTKREAAYVVICSAAFHDSDWSNAVTACRRSAS